MKLLSTSFSLVYSPISPCGELLLKDKYLIKICCCSITKSCPTLPLCAVIHQAPLSSTNSWILLKFMSIELLKFMSIESVILSNHVKPFASNLSKHQDLFL